jgi:N-acetylneuraminic acid mutarotase
MNEGRRQTSLVRTRKRRRTAAEATATTDATAGVYVTGGNNQGCSLSLIDDVDKYTPDNDAWTSRASLVCPDRQGHGAVTLQWGGTEEALFVVGGNSGSSNFLVDCDRYTVDAWTQRTSMPSPGRFKAAVFAWQGRYGVYAGGRNGTAAAVPRLRDVDRYDPDTDAWFAAHSLPFPRGDPAGFSINGIGYMHGGTEAADDTPSGLLYSFNGSWIQKTSSPSPARSEHRGFTIGSRGYIVGGRDGNETGTDVLKDLDRYDQATDSWTSLADAWGRRRQHTAAAVGDAGYVQGGKDDGESGTVASEPNDCYGFSETAGWFETMPLPAPTRYLAAAASL